MHILFRITLTILIVLALVFINIDTNMFATITSAHLAGLQFDDSNASAVVASTGMHHISAFMSLTTLAGLFGIVALWLAPLKEFLSHE
jgi:hypothetical protein